MKGSKLILTLLWHVLCCRIIVQENQHNSNANFPVFQV